MLKIWKYWYIKTVRIAGWKFEAGLLSPLLIHVEKQTVCGQRVGNLFKFTFSYNSVHRGYTNLIFSVCLDYFSYIDLEKVKMIRIVTELFCSWMWRKLGQSNKVSLRKYVNCKNSQVLRKLYVIIIVKNEIIFFRNSSVTNKHTTLHEYDDYTIKIKIVY